MNRQIANTVRLAECGELMSSQTRRWATKLAMAAGFYVWVPLEMGASPATQLHS
ncbi:hypothetical protein [Alcanivorax sp. S71-1-4]|uniref:hypothetical protein n=1 Tax=Alcanivorax sp. S71-1-4 TaxID=1177159 RepID=UPI001358BB44|nr:hypothetical protein [Alcanivorax sp. S71-1-4]